MLATAPAHTTTTTCLARPIRTDLVLPRTITARGRVCSPPTLSFTSTGVAVAHFLLDCDDLTDLRMQRLAHPGTSVVDVTVWGPDAVFVADGPNAGVRNGAIDEAAKAGEYARWIPTGADTGFAQPIRRTIRVAVHGTPRRGLWYPIWVGAGRPLPLGLVAEGLPRVMGPELRG